MDFIKGINIFFRKKWEEVMVTVVGTIAAAIIISNFGYIKDKVNSWFTAPSDTKEWRSKYLDEKLERYAFYNTEEARHLYVPTRYQEDRPDMDEVAKPGAKNPTHKELIPYFLDKVFKKNNPNRFYCVLAETGMGKTTFLVQLLIAYINKYNEKTLPYDIYILPLADKDVFDRIKKLPESSKQNTILLLDGLDENVNAYDRKDAAGNIINTYEKFREELEQAVEPFRFVVITCRTQFFPDNKSELKEVRNVLHTYSTPDKSLPRYKHLYISPFSDEDIDDYIWKKYEWKGTRMSKAKEIIGSIKSLAIRPLILSYIDVLMDGEVNNVLDAYRIIIDKWLQREVYAIRDEDERTRQKELLYDFSRKLAVYIYGHWKETGALYLTQAEYEAFKTKNPDFNGVDYSLASKSLVTRDNQHNILFAHKSFLEYFCAEQVFMGKFSDFYFPGMDMAKTFFELFCQADEKELLPDENVIDKAQRYNVIGWVFKEKIGDYDKALKYCCKAMRINEILLGKVHPSTAQSYNNIGTVYSDKGDYDMALKYYMDALSIREKVFGTDHPTTAGSFYNIGNVYSSKGDYDKALEYHLKALVIEEKVLGKDHPSTAQSYTNIGNAYSGKGDNDKALEYYLKALEIQEKVLGKEHLDIAYSYISIGNVYSYKGDYVKALEYYPKALEIEEKVLGKEHPLTAQTINNIGGAYYGKGDYNKAWRYYQKGLEIREKVLGKEHPDTAQSYNNIGTVYSDKGDYDTALKYLLMAKDIFEKKLGPKHPYTRGTYRNIGNVYTKMGNKEEAQKWYDKARK